MAHAAACESRNFLGWGKALGLSSACLACTKHRVVPPLGQYIPGMAVLAYSPSTWGSGVAGVGGSGVQGRLWDTQELEASLN